MELIRNKEFKATIFNLDNKFFVVHIIFLASFNLDINVYLLYNGQRALLIFIKAPIAVPYEDAYFVDVFSPDFPAELSN